MSEQFLQKISQCRNNSKIQSQNHSKWQNQYPNTQMHECSLIIKIEHYNSYEGWIQLAKYFLKMVFNTDTDLAIYFLYLYLGPLWSWSYDSCIYNYHYNQCLSPLKLLKVVLNTIKQTLSNIYYMIEHKFYNL